VRPALDDPDQNAFTVLPARGIFPSSTEKKRTGNEHLRKKLGALANDPEADI
jgi:hypothetical protein